MDFDFVFFGQSCLKYKTPVEVFAGLQDIYEKRKKELPKANKQLVGKKTKYLFIMRDLIQTR
jgi:hypothetical protein